MGDGVWRERLGWGNCWQSPIGLKANTGPLHTSLVQVHIWTKGVATTSLEAGKTRPNLRSWGRRMHHFTIQFYPIVNTGNRNITHLQETTWTHRSSSLLRWVCSKPCHVVYNGREVGWPIESYLRKDLAIGINYSLDPCNTRNASCQKSLTISPVIIL